MGKFSKLRKNKNFSYSPRYYDGKEAENPFKIEHKFDQFRSTVNTPRGLRGKFKSAFADLRREGDRNTKLRLLIIIAVLVLIFLYIIDFDLSIFTKR